MSTFRTLSNLSAGYPRQLSARSRHWVCFKFRYRYPISLHGYWESRDRSMPICGLSSSATLFCRFVMAIDNVNSLGLTRLQERPRFRFQTGLYLHSISIPAKISLLSGNASPTVVASMRPAILPAILPEPPLSMPGQCPEDALT